ncbi:hypothetical protein NDU88_007406 [Pleurodeles waltl]|uniref:Secreted protein n=1 Tax=Pleurodeles waltl TaxID=8319 RepID=A0AAV7SSF4_PLEWA|nr:hypothetical protein NDU88_007406 [Pleurodeles waltl]
MIAFPVPLLVFSASVEMMGGVDPYLGKRKQIMQISHTTSQQWPAFAPRDSHGECPPGKKAAKSESVRRRGLSGHWWKGPPGLVGKDDCISGSATCV